MLSHKLDFNCCANRDGFTSPVTIMAFIRSFPLSYNLHCIFVRIAQIKFNLLHYKYIRMYSIYILVLSNIHMYMTQHEKTVHAKNHL